jgi:hypothetical protein
MGGEGMTAKVILATLILFSPFILLCVVTALVEGSQRIGRWFDGVNDKVDRAIVRSLERNTR